ncbi:MAG: ABC transporter permease [Candidatus Mcinerneyibacterium aminivorans]|uniref:ABC transporter permease n=1 Tax=Candidatus Mcinerneyibacterium aminivorans TaxID=2703815 RepID=A0A5D0MJP7_9BACT|nr:MAG: ABC transporter permease [Candidatus Mcinerneyibacterium aminivorans]
MTGKWLIIFKKKFLETVKSKAFILSTILVPLIIVLIIGVVVYLQIQSSKKIRKYYYIDKSKNIVSKLKKKLPENYKFTRWSESKEKALEKIKSKKIDTFLYIKDDVLDTYEIEYYSRSVSDAERMSILKNEVTDIIHEMIMEKKGLNKEEVGFLLKKANISSYKVTKEEGSKKESASLNYALSYGLLYALIIVILMNAPKLVQSTIEDKNNRVVEIVVSHVKAIDLMIGKIIGTATAGLLQIFVWVGMTLISIIGVTSYFADKLPSNFIGSIKSSVDFKTLLFFLLYFILNFFVYAIAYAGIGAMFSNEKDANQFIQPIAIMTFSPFFFFLFVSQNPEAPLSVILSEIPYLSPLMFMRMAIIDIPAWQIVLSITLLITTIFVELWASAKIFRIGILSYGKKPKIKEIIGWLKS